MTATTANEININLLLDGIVKALEGHIYDEFKYILNQMVDDGLDGVEFENLRDEVLDAVCERLTISYK